MREIYKLFNQLLTDKNITIKTDIDVEYAIKKGLIHLEYNEIYKQLIQIIIDDKDITLAKILFVNNTILSIDADFINLLKNDLSVKEILQTNYLFTIKEIYLYYIINENNVIDLFRFGKNFLKNLLQGTELYTKIYDILKRHHYLLTAIFCLDLSTDIFIRYVTIFNDQCYKFYTPFIVNYDLREYLFVRSIEHESFIKDLKDNNWLSLLTDDEKEKLYLYKKDKFLIEEDYFVKFLYYCQQFNKFLNKEDKKILIDKLLLEDNILYYKQCLKEFTFDIDDQEKIKSQILLLELKK